MKKFLLFLAPFLITAVLVIGYFMLRQKISNIDLPNIPSISFSDLVKFSRFSLEKAPSTSLVGLITSMSGEVLYEPRLATESARIMSPVEIQQGESLSTGADGTITLNFKDLAEINVNPESTLGIIQTLPADLVFSQSVGDIEYKKIGNIPVSIRTHHLLVENNGDVTISIDKIKPLIYVSLASGRVTVAYNNINNDTRMLNLNSGESLIFNDDTRRVELK